MNVPALNLLIVSVYYILTALIVLFSIFGIYLLIRYGRSIILALVLSGIYVFLTLTLLFQSHQILQAVLS